MKTANSNELFSIIFLCPYKFLTVILSSKLIELPGTGRQRKRERKKFKLKMYYTLGDKFLIIKQRWR